MPINPQAAATKGDLKEAIGEVTERLDVHDQQFQRILEFIKAEGKETREHTDETTEKVMDQVQRLSNSVESKFTEHERRITRLEELPPLGKALGVS